MGFFSWKTLDGNQSISNSSSSRGALPVVLLIPEDVKFYDYIEENYEGYGEFGNHDAYILLARINASERCTGDDDHDRRIGIEIGGSDKDMSTLEHPLRLVSLAYFEKTQCTYEDFPDDAFSHSDERQGFFYD